MEKFLNEINRCTDTNSKFVVDGYEFKVNAVGNESNDEAGTLCIIPRNNLPCHDKQYSIRLHTSSSWSPKLEFCDENMTFCCNISTPDSSGNNFRLSLDYSSHRYWGDRLIWPMTVRKMKKNMVVGLQ